MKHGIPFTAVLLIKSPVTSNRESGTILNWLGGRRGMRAHSVRKSSVFLLSNRDLRREA